MNHFSKLIDSILGKSTFGFDLDTRIRQAANEMTALALFETFDQVDISKEGWEKGFIQELNEITTGDPSILIGFDDGRREGLESSGEGNEFLEEADEPENEFSQYLKLKFTDEDAAYYQFHLFPPLDEPFVIGACRKRAGDTQFLRIDLTDEQHLQTFFRTYARIHT